MHKTEKTMIKKLFERIIQNSTAKKANENGAKNIPKIKIQSGKFNVNFRNSFSQEKWESFLEKKKRPVAALK